MSDTVLLVRHMPGERDDQVQQELQRRGFRLETCWVAEGQSLPEPDGRFAATVVYGGSQMASRLDEHDYLRRELAWIERWLAGGRPFLGLCLGGQLLAQALGARVAPHADGLAEIGFFPLAATEEGRGLFPETLSVYQWHREGFELPQGARLLARGETFPNQAFSFGSHAFGLQFHPEITRAMMLSWLKQAAHMLQEPGAHSRTRQLADARQHHRRLGDWLRDFLDHWLPQPHPPRSAAAEEP